MALFWRGTGTNWSDTTAWSASDGGGSAGVIPAATDDVNFTANGNGNSCTLDVAVAKVAKTLTINGYTKTLTFNVQLSVSGSITFTTTGFTFAGTTTNKLRMIAAGTWTTNGKTIAQDVEIGGTTTFTCTLAAGFTTSGDLFLTNTTSTILSGANTTITCVNLTISGSQTVTLPSVSGSAGFLVATGLTTIADANVLTSVGNGTLQTASLTVTGALTTASAALVILSGGGTWQGAAACSTPVTVNGDTALSGTVLFSASGTPTLTLANNVDLTSGTLSIASACTIVGGTSCTVSALTITAALTLTLNTTAVTFTTITTPNAATTFAGNVGFIAGTLANTAIASSAKTYTLTQGNTYRCTTAMNWTGATSALTLTIASSSGASKVVFYLDPTATQDMLFVAATRVDSSLGQIMFAHRGTLTTCFGWSTAIAEGNLLPTAGGETVTVSGVTKDNTGAILGSCIVNIYMDNGDNTSTYVGTVTSNASTGAWSLAVLPRVGAVYFGRAYKGGATPVSDSTNLLTAV
jgi:hypothetical protein